MSKGEKDDGLCVRLLNQMCEKLKNRSLVSKILASVCCNANEPLLKRDSNKQEHILQQVHADGDIQGEKRKNYVVITITELRFIR